MIKPKEIIAEYLSDINPKTVLDLGCGEGKLSLRFLKKGAKITGIDKKDHIFKDENFKFINKDIREYKIDKKYDLIISSLILHFLFRPEAEKIIVDIKEHTESGGYNFLVCLSDKDSLSKKEKFYPNLSELKKLYSDWEIVKSIQGDTPVEEHDNLKPHTHNIIFLLAKK